MLQRLTALAMVPLVFGHLAVMIYAVQGGISAAEILGRTQGSFAWFTFYGLFVLAASVHGAIGLRSIVSEWLNWSNTERGNRLLNLFTFLVFGLLFSLGLMAVVGVVAP